MYIGGGLFISQYSNMIEEIWVNPNPNAAFAAQKVTLSKNISNYRFYMISFVADYQEPWIVGTVISPIGNMVGMRTYNFNPDSSKASGLLMMRGASPSGTNQMEFFQGFYANPNTTPANYGGACVPRRIWGIK